MIEICGGILGRVFHKEGTTLDKLGIGELTRDELLRFMETGEIVK